MFKIGDRLLVIKGHNHYMKTGTIVTCYRVFEQDGDTFISINEEEFITGTGWYPDRFVLATPLMEALC